jgi:hypothetical protein
VVHSKEFETAKQHIKVKGVQEKDKILPNRASIHTSNLAAREREDFDC